MDSTVGLRGAEFRNRGVTGLTEPSTIYYSLPRYVRVAAARSRWFLTFSPVLGLPDERLMVARRTSSFTLP
jgi:hypothetical protein